MALNETGNFRYDGYGFNSVDEAKTRLAFIKMSVPDFLLGSIDNESISIDVKTSKISAHLSAALYEYDI